jgi:hypothetical protein
MSFERQGYLSKEKDLTLSIAINMRMISLFYAIILHVLYH